MFLLLCTVLTLVITVMPDALSKTVPIWCSVMNRALFPSDSTYHAVQLPPSYLGASEESQIEQRVDGFVESLKVIFPGCCLSSL